MELSEGRPLDTEGRLEKEVRVYDLLDQLGITYWRTDHEAAGTMEDCNEIDRILDVLICKNLFLCNRQKTKFYMLMMPGDKPFKTKDTDNQVQLLVDEDVLQGEFLGCHPCINTSSLKLRTKDVFEKFLPAVHHEYMVVRLGQEEEK